MEKNFPSINLSETLMITATIIFGLAFVLIKYWIPSVEYYRSRRRGDPKIQKIIKYNSLVDPKEIFLFNFNLSDITVHTRRVGMSYGRCLKTCSMNKKLNTLVLLTDDAESIQMSFYRINLMDNLTFLSLNIENAKHFSNDFLLPIIQNAKNLESIVYRNAYVSSLSMSLLIELPKLNFLIMDNIHVTDSKAFSIMLFNLKVRQLSYHLKYGIY